MSKKMVLKRVYIDSDHDDGLKRMSRMLGVSESEIIREAVGAALSGFAPSRAVAEDAEERARRWRETLELMSQMELVTPPGEPIWDRELLYEERLSRW